MAATSLDLGFHTTHINHPFRAFRLISDYHHVKQSETWRLMPEGWDGDEQIERGTLTIMVGEVTGPYRPRKAWEGTMCWYQVQVTWRIVFEVTGEERITEGTYAVYEDGSFALFMKALPEMEAQPGGKHCCLSVGEVWYASRAGRGHLSYTEPLHTCMCGEVDPMRHGLPTATLDRALVKQHRSR